MLLNFKMENFRSFKDATYFTMIPTKIKAHHECLIDKHINKNRVRALPMTVIYGANACGKSNIILAMDILKKMVMKGVLNCKELEPYKNVLSFIRDTSWYSPIFLEITFASQNDIYRYGIKFTDVPEYHVVEEFLFVNEELFFRKDSENKIHVDIGHLIKENYISSDDRAFAERLVSKLNQTVDNKKLVVSGAISNLFKARHFEDFISWFENFNVIMNANEVDFKQKDLKTIIRDRSNTDIRRDILESNSVKAIMDIAA